MTQQPISEKTSDNFLSKYLLKSQGKFIIILVLTFLIGVVCLVWSLWRLSSSVVESMALQNATVYARTLGTIRNYYANEVVARLRESEVEITHDYHAKTQAIPLPATLNIELGNQITEFSEGVQVRFYSDYPFPWRTDGGAKDDFEREALAQLRQNAGQAFSRFEVVNGRYSLRYAAASVMQESCVDCHNTHPDTPKADWQVGDVRGVLEVVQPVDDTFGRVELNLQLTFVLTIIISLGGLVGLGFIIHRLNQNSLALSQYATDLEHEITERKRAEAERLRLSVVQQEIKLARNLQRSLLPPARPDWTDIDAVCYNYPAHGVSGDFYTYHTFPQQDGQPRVYAFVVGDVTGKGMAAALLMSISLASFRSSIGNHFKPDELMKHLDKILLDYTKSAQENCAMIYMEIEYHHQPKKDDDALTHTLYVTNAGCIAPIIRRANGEVEWVEAGGLPLGSNINIQFNYQTVALQLAPGDFIILSSDGIVEANNRDNEMFGFERLEQVVANAPNTTAESMLNYIQTEVSNFADGADPHDDLTIIVVKV